MEQSREQHLVSQAKAGSPQATAELIRAHQTSLYVFLLRMCGSRELAEDATQEALYRSIKSLHRYDPRWRFSTWLFTIGKRVLLGELEKRRPRASSDLMESSDGSTPPIAPVWTVSGWTEEQAEQRGQQREKLSWALQQLSDVQREVLLLHHQQQWDVATMAQTLGLAEGTIKSHLFRARARMRELLGGEREQRRRDGLAGGTDKAAGADTKTLMNTQRDGKGSASSGLNGGDASASTDRPARPRKDQA